MERVSNHSLMVWRKRAERMGEVDKKFLKPLYEGLKQLTEDERQFLMDKYFYPDKPISDKKMAEQLCIKTHVYYTKRAKIEAKLVIKDIKIEDLVFKKQTYDIFDV